eukprot:25078-Amphidinium_carterae.1
MPELVVLVQPSLALPEGLRLASIAQTESVMAEVWVNPGPPILGLTTGISCQDCASIDNAMLATMSSRAPDVIVWLMSKGTNEAAAPPHTFHDDWSSRSSDGSY